eukprot:COSAG06_NODE_6702_length_2819_cov_3.351838_3_plen_158_part_00
MCIVTRSVQSDSASLQRQTLEPSFMRPLHTYSNHGPSYVSSPVRGGRKAAPRDDRAPFRPSWPFSPPKRQRRQRKASGLSEIDLPRLSWRKFHASTFAVPSLNRPPAERPTYTANPLLPPTRRCTETSRTSRAGTGRTLAPSWAVLETEAKCRFHMA